MTTPSPHPNGDRNTKPDVVDAGPFTAQWDVTRVAQTTFVTVQVTNAHTRERTARIENRLDGDVRPPRSRGVAERGWDTDGVTRTIPGGETVSLGYACDAPVVEPPLSLEEVPHETTDVSPVARALRSLDDHAPPRAATPVGSETPNRPRSAGASETVEISKNSGSTDPPTPDDPSAGGDSPPVRGPATGFTTPSADMVAANSTNTDDPDEDTTDASPREPDPAATDTDTDSDAPDGSRSTTPSDAPTPSTVPLTVTAWFRAVDARLDTAARLDGPVADATPVIASLGGRRGVTALETTLERDARALRAVADRAAALAARIEETDVPELGVTG